MCGILGQIELNKQINEEEFGKMLDTLIHRGPDDSGEYFNAQKNIALGHRRLSFLDLSRAGKQPLANNEKTIWITFNGEIYNYPELKEQLKNKYEFNTETDTEVILAAYQEWGIDCLQKLKGMFAFGLYDTTLNKLFLVRDRFGIKPLYYAKINHTFLFGSELKAIMASGIIPKQVNFSSLADYFVYRYIPSPKTIWQDVCKLPPAHYLELNTLTLSSSTKEYWTLKSEENFEMKEILVNEVNQILAKSVQEHTRADVPIGSFLSGGYDSSALVYYMKQAGHQPQTFSIGFEDWEKSEDQFAKIVADSLGVENTSVQANEESLKLLNLMANVYDEPIADISIIPTYIVSKLAQTKVKAVLSGEGADEIFGGYTWQHEFLSKKKRWFDFFFSKDTVSFYANSMAMGWFDSDELKQLLHPNLHKFIPMDVHWFYRKHFNKNLSPLKSIQMMDMKCFMGELVLTKIDRASMANSLEVRVPFLDHTLFEKLFSIPEKDYYNPNQTKELLFQNIKNYLPKEILDRKKQGFVGPDSYYMNLEFYKKELANSSLVKHHIINQKYLDKLLTETYNWKLWKILVMEKWFRKWID
ncbi:MAG: asparagine synthase (glutamine-hydrolyzing) [Bacteroidia bacterium]|nr:asparagine synthase (glutamine-hydrolyzing) [Bacteroidia bacterium]MCF8427058.1 asparagine synthase (glutamine-hydrolyzing) [Bacteroidia bacterium]MCF8446458.1 asparagine synthase (glutamine-hydrolyzing) [Bacteroidia bacterium]